MTDRIAELEQQLAQARDHVAELEAYALGCDAEGCTTPHSSWCERAKKAAAANDGCTCPQPWKGSPQPHAAYCWLVSPPRDEVEEMRKKVAQVIAGRNAAAVELGKAARKAIAKAEADLAEMTRLRDNALRALSREDVDLDVANLPDLIGDGLSGGGWRWENDPQDTCPQQLVDDIVGIVRPVIAGVTQQRDQARRIAVQLEQETARLADELAETKALNDPRLRGLLVKADKARDLYVQWSTVCDMPAGVFSRETALEYGFPRSKVDHADEHGSSSRLGDGAWDDKGWVAEQRGWLKRERLGDYAIEYLHGDREAAYRLLEPFSDEAKADQ